MPKEQEFIVRATILAEEVAYYFEETIQGMYSDMAYYEMVLRCHSYAAGRLKREALLDYLGFVFNIQEEDFQKIEEKYQDRAGAMIRALNGEEEEEDGEEENPIS